MSFAAVFGLAIALGCSGKKSGAPSETSPAPAGGGSGSTGEAAGSDEENSTATRAAESDEANAAAASDETEPPKTPPEERTAPSAEAKGFDEATAAALARGELKLTGFAATGERGEAPPATGTVAILGRHGAGNVRRISSCDSFFAKVRSHGTPKTLGAPPYEVTLDFGRVRHGDKTIVELADSFCKDYDGSKGDLSTDWRTQRWAILSLVGPVLSVDVQSSEAAAGGPPSHGESWKTLEVRTGKEADFTAIVTEASLLKALKADSVIQKRFGQKMAKVQSLDAAISLIESAWGDLGGYAFYEYDADRKRAAMRVAFLPSWSSMSPNRVKTLGLWVEPKPRYRESFEKAQKKGGGLYKKDGELPLLP